MAALVDGEVEEEDVVPLLRLGVILYDCDFSIPFVDCAVCASLMFQLQ